MKTGCDGMKKIQKTDWIYNSYIITAHANQHSKSNIEAQMWGFFHTTNYQS